MGKKSKKFKSKGAAEPTQGIRHNLLDLSNIVTFDSGKCTTPWYRHHVWCQ